jgi:CheY-like chemotaxis protein
MERWGASTDLSKGCKRCARETDHGRPQDGLQSRGEPVIPANEPLKILLVDDYIPSRNVLEESLEGDDFTIVTSENGLEAIHTLKKNRFDLVITDLKMPGATGIEVLKNAREMNPDVQVIIITGYASLETAIEAIKSGAYDYITRPFKLDEIKVVVNNACEKIRLIKENQRLMFSLEELYRKMKGLQKKETGTSGRSLEELYRKMKGLQKKETGTSGRKKVPLTEELDVIGSFLNFRSVAGGTLPLSMQKRRSDKGYVLVELEKLGQLRDEGVLSQDEFDRCKRKILEKL